MVDTRVVAAIFRKDMRQYLGNPTGYVFLTLFIVSTAAAAFLTDAFFSRNLADLAQLNQWMPYILTLFVPALTMSSWAEERRAGTDELLLTMPARDAEVVLGKYLGVLGMYTVSLGFSVANLFVLMYLGDPDSGLMASTYFGYWLMGAMFCAIGLVASMFTSNSAIAFVLGVLGCGLVVFAGYNPQASGFAGTAVVALLVAIAVYTARRDSRGASWAALAAAVLSSLAWGRGFFSGDEEVEPLKDNDFIQALDAVSVQEHFASFGEGVLRLGDVTYFVAFTLVTLYLANFFLGRRHW